MSTIGQNFKLASRAIHLSSVVVPHAVPGIIRMCIRKDLYKNNGKGAEQLAKLYRHCTKFSKATPDLPRTALPFPLLMPYSGLYSSDMMTSSNALLNLKMDSSLAFQFENFPNNGDLSVQPLRPPTSVPQNNAASVEIRTHYGEVGEPRQHILINNIPLYKTFALSAGEVLASWEIFFENDSRNVPVKFEVVEATDKELNIDDEWDKISTWARTKAP